MRDKRWLKQPQWSRLQNLEHKTMSRMNEKHSQILLTFCYVSFSSHLRTTCR